MCYRERSASRPPVYLLKPRSNTAYTRIRARSILSVFCIAQTSIMCTRTPELIRQQPFGRFAQQGATTPTFHSLRVHAFVCATAVLSYPPPPIFPPLSDEQVRAVQALPDGRLASASQDHTARLWTPKDGAANGASGVYFDMGGQACCCPRSRCDACYVHVCFLAKVHSMEGKTT